MSENKKDTVDPSNEEKALHVLSFLHQKLLTVSFFPEEFAQADASLKFIQHLAEDLSKKIQESKETVSGDPEETN